MQSILHSHIRNRLINVVLQKIRTHQIHEINQGRSVHVQYHYLFPILKKYEDKFYNYTRMSLSCIEYICCHIHKSCERSCNLHTQPILLEEKLVTLRYNFILRILNLNKIIKFFIL